MSICIRKNMCCYNFRRQQRDAMGELASRSRPIGEIINAVEHFLNQVIGQLDDVRVGGAL